MVNKSSGTSRRQTVVFSVQSKLAELSRSKKRLIMILSDLIALPLALWSGYALRFAEFWPIEQMWPFVWFFCVMPFVGIFVFARLGLYRAVVRFMGPQAIAAVVKGVGLLALLMWASAYFYQLAGFPRSIPIIFALVALIYVGGTRFLVRSYYHWLTQHFSAKEPVLIYGAGSSGVQLCSALTHGSDFCVAAFIDDDQALWGSTVRGLKVHAPDELAALVEQQAVTQVLLALPSASNQQRKRIIDRLNPLPVHVQTVPAMGEIIAGRASIDQLREVALEDLLGRDPVPPQAELFARCIKSKAVLVTGAGGSIGSELCRQIISACPKTLVLYEQSEYALYAIEQELSVLIGTQSSCCQIIPVLGSVCNAERMRTLIGCYGVETIYHAAAYKHVPIVEHNIFEGIRNNIFGTRTVMQVAAELGVDHCILISTDKAVRPTNVMGATKRMAELVVQNLAEQHTQTIFSMVRFGNVLGSSGSVVPLFRKQIEAGGPVTVTHQEITRYFMTIPEAAQLVVQAGAMAKGGDVFVLDMGEPVKISELARRMIQLTGLEVRSETEPDGDIEITYSGLRPGEKLYEELLIGANVIGTEHPKIMRAEEGLIAADRLQSFLSALEQTEVDVDCAAARQILEQAVQGFVPSSPIVDLIHAPLVKEDAPVLKLL